MQPNTPAPTPSDYDFILNHGGNKPKRSLLPGFGGNKKQRRIVLGIAGGVLLLFIILVYSLLFGGNKNQDLLAVAQSQQELIRISAQGVDKTSSSTARALAVTTELSVTTNQRDVLAQLKKRGQKTSPKLLAAKKNAQTDAALTQASTDNRYDEVFTKTIQTQLVEYQKLLKTAYSSVSNQALQNILNSEFSQAGILIASTQPAT